jgi:restriction system protein
MKIKIKKIFSIITLVMLIVINPSLGNSNDTWSKVSANNETCWYKSENGKLLKRCESNLAKDNIQPSTQDTTIEEHQQILKIEPTNFQKTPQLQTLNIQPLSKNSTFSFDQTKISENNKNDVKQFSFFYLIIALIVGFLLGNKKRESSAEFIQDQAEKMVAKELDKLDKKYYCIMHDVTLPIGIGTTQIDHILFSEYGIFVIETKSHKGWIFGKENDGNWTQVLKGGKKYSFHNPLIQNNNHIKYIEKIANIERRHISNIVVFTNQDMELKSSLPKHVLKLTELKSYIEKTSCEQLNKQKLYEILGCIEFNRKDRSIQTNKDHIAFVKKRYNL